MTTLTRSITIDAPVDAVFEYALDVGRLWTVKDVALTEVDIKPEGVGTSARMFTHLLAEGRIGTLTLKNRMVMPPMGSFHTEADGSVGDELVAYYAARAEGGFGLIIQEYTCVSPEGLGGPREPRLWSDDDHYRELSAKALRYAERPQMDPEFQFRTFLDVLGRAADDRKAVAA